MLMYQPPICDHKMVQCLNQAWHGLVQEYFHFMEEQLLMDVYQTEHLVTLCSN